MLYTWNDMCALFGRQYATWSIVTHLYTCPNQNLHIYSGSNNCVMWHGSLLSDRHTIITQLCRFLLALQTASASFYIIVLVLHFTTLLFSSAWPPSLTLFSSTVGHCFVFFGEAALRAYCIYLLSTNYKVGN